MSWKTQPQKIHKSAEEKDRSSEDKHRATEEIPGHPRNRRLPLYIWSEACLWMTKDIESD